MPPRPAITPTPALRYWRTQRGLLQRELAQRAGVHQTTITRMERGLPTALDTIRRLAEALAVVPGDLIREPPGFDEAIVTPPAVKRSGP